MTDDSKKAENNSHPVCPACASTRFYVDGLVGHRQPYDATSGEYGVSKMNWDEDYPMSAVCAECEKDVTDLFKKFDILTFFTPNWKQN